MARLDIEDVAHSYVAGADRKDWALQPLRLTLEDSRTYALVGPSGCGKTTLLNVLSGLVTPTQGRVRFDGVDVTELPTKARNIAQVFQFPVIYNSMTVYENLAFPLQGRRWDKARIDAKVHTVAEALGLEHRLRQPARRLTADDKQLISLGRGLVRDDVAALLMDEPLTVIDPQLKFSLRRKIREISEQFQPTVIYVTHDQYEAMSFAQELLVMKGEVVFVEISGSETFVHLTVGDAPFVVQIEGIHDVGLGETVMMRLRPERLFAFDPAGQLVRAPESGPTSIPAARTEVGG